MDTLIALQNRIEDILDYGFKNHIPLTSEYLARSLLGEYAIGPGETYSRIQTLQPIICKLMSHLTLEENLRQMPNEERTALSYLMTMIFEPLKYLTDEECQEIYLAEQYKYDKIAIEHQLVSSIEDYVQTYAIDKYPITDNELDEMINNFRNKLNKMNAPGNSHWSAAKSGAIERVLKNRKNMKG